MSDILTNARRYNPSNATRTDITKHGENQGTPVTTASGTFLQADCSGFQNHVLRESGYNVPYGATSQVVDPKTNQLTSEGLT